MVHRIKEKRSEDKIGIGRKTLIFSAVGDKSMRKSGDRSVRQKKRLEAVCTSARRHIIYGVDCLKCGDDLLLQDRLKKALASKERCA